jgi:hypothetical protein
MYILALDGAFNGEHITVPDDTELGDIVLVTDKDKAAVYTLELWGDSDEPVLMTKGVG